MLIERYERPIKYRKDGKPDRRSTDPHSYSPKPTHPWKRDKFGQTQFRNPKGYVPRETSA